MAERMVSAWRCTVRTEGTPRIWLCNTGRPALYCRRIALGKPSGSPAVAMTGLHSQKQRKRGFLRRGREASTVDGAIVIRGSRAKVDSSKLTPAKVDSSTLTQYTDSWLEVKAIEFMTQRMASLSGKATDLKGYDGFVDISRKFVNGLPSKQQRKKVIQVLHVVLPEFIQSFVREMPKTTATKETYAKFTTIFFKWLIGECEVRDGEIDGVTMKSTVYIKKCRFLEQSQCVGLCVNLCKNPTQTFIREQFGMPLTMKPNFEDMSCEMIYGLHPPPLEEDPAYRQPCFSLCQTAKQRPNCT